MMPLSLLMQGSVCCKAACNAATQCCPALPGCNTSCSALGSRCAWGGCDHGCWGTVHGCARHWGGLQLPSLPPDPSALQVLAHLTWAEQGSRVARISWDQSHLTVPCQRQLSPLPSAPAVQLWLHRWHLAGRSAVLRRAFCLSDSAALEGRPAAQWLRQGWQQTSGTEGVSSDHLPSQVSDLRSLWLDAITYRSRRLCCCLSRIC